MPFDESGKTSAGNLQSSYYKESLKRSADFRKIYNSQKVVVKSGEMPWENSPQGLIRHMVNEAMNTREYCLDIYQQYLPAGGRSGKHRHLTEEVLYILEGEGYDLHWDVIFDCKDAYQWDWEKDPKKFKWREGDFVYIPPYCIHQHFNAGDGAPARFISITSRIIKAMGFDWLDQLENGPDYKEE